MQLIFAILRKDNANREQRKTKFYSAEVQLIFAILRKDNANREQRKTKFCFAEVQLIFAILRKDNTFLPQSISLTLRILYFCSDMAELRPSVPSNEEKHPIHPRPFVAGFYVSTSL